MLLNILLVKKSNYMNTTRALQQRATQDGFMYEVQQRLRTTRVSHLIYELAMQSTKKAPVI
jgi:hypothetical protein